MFLWDTKKMLYIQNGWTIPLIREVERAVLQIVSAQSILQYKCAKCTVQVVFNWASANGNIRRSSEWLRWHYILIHHWNYMLSSLMCDGREERLCIGVYLTIRDMYYMYLCNCIFQLSKCDLLDLLVATLDTTTKIDSVFRSIAENFHV